MIRRFASRCVLAWMLVGACAGSTMAATASARPLFTGSATGTVIAVGSGSFTIQTAGRRIGVVNAMTAAANGITERDYPYVYGGGHAEAGTASIGIRGPGYNGRRVGFDCSGSVAAVLSSAGLWPAGGGVPNDAGIIATLRSGGLIARGVGRGPVEVTLYDDPGVHIFMNIDGRFFGTSDGGGGGDPRGGAGWLDDGAPDASSSTYRPFHFLPSVLRASTSSGHILSFQLAAGQEAPALALGDTVQIGYRENASGALVATAVGFPGATTTAGTVAAIAPDGSSFTVQTTSGASVTLSTAGDQTLIQDLAVGDTVEVMYTTNGAALTARTVTITGSAAAGSG
ncbi:MAG TPA: hypothetical protein VGI50_00515 [Solirubrobacteraceae bacterium]